MTADFSITSIDSWQPIGYYNSDSDYVWYQGTLDGGNHTIDGLIIDANTNYQGLIGYASGCTIKDLKLTNTIISGPSYIGSFAGHFTDGSIINCENSGIVEGTSDDSTSFVGGIVGQISGTSSIINCINSGEVAVVNSTSYAHIGGIVATINGTTSQVTISNCVNSANVTVVQPCMDCYCGGIVGSMGGTGSIVSYNTNTGDVTGNGTSTSHVGGIIGSVGAAVDYTISDNTNTGTVDGGYDNGIT